MTCRYRCMVFCIPEEWINYIGMALQCIMQVYPLSGFQILIRHEVRSLLRSARQHSLNCIWSNKCKYVLHRPNPVRSFAFLIEVGPMSNPLWSIFIIWCCPCSAIGLYTRVRQFADWFRQWCISVLRGCIPEDGGGRAGSGYKHRSISIQLTLGFNLGSIFAQMWIGTC